MAKTNELRTNPLSFVPYFNEIKAQFTHATNPNIRVLPSGTLLLTNEGPAAVDEAIAYCQNAAAVPAMQWDQLLGFASKVLADEQGPTTQTGHTGPNGSTMQSRIETFGQWQTTIGENIAYGNTNAQEIIAQLFIDDGVASRGHRVNLMKPEFLFMGARSGPHGQYNHMTAINYAGGMTTNNFQALTTVGDPASVYPPASGSSSSTPSE